MLVRCTRRERQRENQGGEKLTKGGQRAQGMGIPRAGPPSASRRSRNQSMIWERGRRTRSKMELTISLCARTRSAARLTHPKWRLHVRRGARLEPGI